ncbi:DUF547 domain-containing protein [Salinibacter sp. 10B]|nr:DUF547 domain-containing protein [Salinibacter sp. 10B]
MLGILIVVGGRSPLQAQQRATSTVVRTSIDHGPFTRLLQRFVDEQGNVEYAQLKAESDSVLRPYLRQLATTNPASLGCDARLAFWINAYNAYTLKLIVEHYPVKNIWAVTPGPAEPKDNSPFALEVGSVADTVRTLDEIEHEIIRERFDEPRIHFALVCAAASCPRLRREAYTGARLEFQLEDQTRTFFHDDEKNRIPAGNGQIQLSRILKWYGQDFGDSTDALQRFIAPYFDGAVRDTLSRAAYEVTFGSYDWTLNDQSSASGAASGRK